MIKQINKIILALTILLLTAVSVFANTTINIDYPRNDQYLIGGNNISVAASVYKDDARVDSDIDWFYDGEKQNYDEDEIIISLEELDDGEIDNQVIKAVYGDTSVQINIKLYNESTIEKTIAYLKSLQTSDGSFNGYDGHYYLAAASGFAGFDVRSYKTGASSYNDYLKTLTFDENSTTGDLMKAIFALSYIGENPSDFNGKDIVQLLLDKQQEDGTFGGGDFTDAAVVIALNNAGVAIPQSAELKQHFEGLNYSGGLYSGAWGTDIDTTTRIVRALKILGANNNDSIIVNAIAGIKSAQADTGAIASWGSVNYDTTSEVVMMLCDLGINPTEGTWNINGKNLVTSILSNQDTDGSFKNDWDKKYSTYEALMALSDYFYTFNTPLTQNSGSHNNSDGGSQTSNNEKSISISVSVIGKNSNTLYPKTIKTIKSNDTFGLTALQALAATGLSYKAKNDNSYVSEVDGLKESTTTTAGWKYKVNGTVLGKAAKNCTLSDGDAVVWFWVNDYTEGESNASENSTKLSTSEDSSKIAVQEGSTTSEKKQTSFNDVTDKNFTWAKKEIEFLAEKGIINGNGNKNFEPNRSISREEFVKMMLLGIGEDAALTEGTQFADDSSISEWAKGYIHSAKKLGIIKGDDKNLFSPKQEITREEAAVILIRTLKIKNMLKSDGSSNIDFKDKDSISSWAKDAILDAAKAGLIKGQPDGNFVGKNHMTRADTAVMLYRSLQ